MCTDDSPIGTEGDSIMVLSPSLYDLTCSPEKKHITTPSDGTPKIHRTRTLIGSLEYGVLKKAGIIPKKTMFTKVPKVGGDFPKVARKITPSLMGIFAEKVFLRAARQQTFSEDDLIDELGVIQNPVTVPVIMKDLEYFQKMATFAITTFPEGSNIMENVEWISGKVAGHPDVVAGDTVYDIKMSGRFGRMRVSTIFQLLTYYALAQANDLPITHIGLILPAQKQVIRIDLSDWDSTKYLAMLQDVAINKETRLDISEEDMLDFINIRSYIGGHTTRRGAMYKNIAPFTTQQPIQIFLGSNIKAKHHFTDPDIAKTLKHVLHHNIHLFVHTPYTLNLSRNYDDDWVYTALVKELETTRAIGGKGAVIHLGKKSKMSYETAYNNMRDNVIRVAVTTTPDCPLLLETDSGGSILDDPVELANFWLDLPSDVQERTAICFDTCHVFASGYENMRMLLMFESLEVPVKLIHYNDSKHSRGSKKDRHAPIGMGLIGFSPLVKVAKYAVSNGIYLARE